MVVYEFYWRDHEGKHNLLGILPERRKDSERITQDSIINWARKVVGDDTESKEITFFRLEI